MTIEQVRVGVRGLTQPDHADEATMTAQYVRLSMFVLVVLLGVSIAWATFRPGGEWQGSISDYFHTPARLALVGTMLGIGVGLMVLYSSNSLENALLNVAGAFAPIVGFAATTQTLDPSHPNPFYVSTADVDVFATTSLPAYFAALVLLACFVYVVHPVGTRRTKSLLTLVVIVGFALATWLVWERWPRKVHVIGAFGFFLPLIILVVASAWSTRDPGDRKLKQRYLWIGSLMVLAAIGYFADRWLIHSKHATFWVETVIVGGFAAFWLLEYIRIAPSTRRHAAQDF